MRAPEPLTPTFLLQVPATAPARSLALAPRQTVEPVVQTTVHTVPGLGRGSWSPLTVSFPTQTAKPFMNSCRMLTAVTSGTPRAGSGGPWAQTQSPTLCWRSGG